MAYYFNSIDGSIRTGDRPYGAYWVQIEDQPSLYHSPVWTGRLDKYNLTEYLLPDSKLTPRTFTAKDLADCSNAPWIGGAPVTIEGRYLILVNAAIVAYVEELPAKLIFTGWTLDLFKQTNTPLDQQMVSLEQTNPISHRSQREVFLSAAIESAKINAVIVAIEAELQLHYDTLKAKFPDLPVHTVSLGRIDDLTTTQGMLRLAALNNAITALRNRRI